MQKYKKTIINNRCLWNNHVNAKCCSFMGKGLVNGALIWKLDPCIAFSHHLDEESTRCHLEWMLRRIFWHIRGGHWLAKQAHMAKLACYACLLTQFCRSSSSSCALSLERYPLRAHAMVSLHIALAYFCLSQSVIDSAANDDSCTASAALDCTLCPGHATTSSKSADRYYVKIWEISAYCGGRLSRDATRPTA